MGKRKRDSDRTTTRKTRILDDRATEGEPAGFEEKVKANGSQAADSIQSVGDSATDVPADKRAQKAKKSKSKSAKTSSTTPITDKAESTSHTVDSTPTASDATSKDPSTQVDSISSTKTPAKSARFILFIGNLPYQTTTAQLSTFFSSLQPTSIRQPTTRDTNKSRGFAFVEFEGYDRMKTCVKKFHHAMFPALPSEKGEESEIEDGAEDDERAKKGKKERKDGRRRINVELTAGGGGGKSEARKAKLKAKNEKLQGERTREAKKLKMQKRAKDKAAKENEDTKSKPVERQPLGERNDEGVLEVDATGTPGANAIANGLGDIHPSRLARIKGAGSGK